MLISYRSPLPKKPLQLNLMRGNNNNQYIHFIIESYNPQINMNFISLNIMSDQTDYVDY
jgi:hypothetical protein